MKCKFLEAKVDSTNCLSVKFELDNKIYSLDDVELQVDRTYEVPHLEFQRFPNPPKRKYGLVVVGKFVSSSLTNNIEDKEPLEVTIEEIEEKFGRKVKIVRGDNNEN